MMAASHAGGRLGASSRGGLAGGPATRRKADAIGVSPTNGRTPVTISYSTMPSAYTSVAGVTAAPSTCSGAM